MSPRQDWYLRDFAETLLYELEQQDAPSTLHLDGFPEPRPGLVYVLVAPHEYLALEGKGALPEEQVLKRTMFVCTRPPSGIELDADVDLLGRVGAVFDLDARSVARHRNAGIPARHLRPGYSKLRDRFDPEAERPIDVMFLGAHSLHRTRQLGRCARILAPHNGLLQISDDSRPNPGGSTSFIAEGKWDLLARTKILLNIHRDEDTHLEWLRVLDAIHAGAVVVTEHASGMSPLVAGEHLLVSGPESLPFVLDAALRDGERLEKLRTRAYEHIRSWLPFALSVSVFRAAAVEIVGRPIAPNASRGLRVPPESDTWASRLASDPEADRMRLGLKDMSLELVRLRRDMSRLEQMVESRSDKSLHSGLVYETPAWARRPKPRVTVITTVCNHAEVVRATLDSLSGSWFRDFELVVVDDASTDDSIEIIQNWMRTNANVSALLARHPGSRGVGAARNTAGGYARGPYCLTLDAGDEIYPRCLQVLVATLDGLPNPVFVYPMLEAFGTTEAFVATGGDYLVNGFGWEPKRLLSLTTVDAPVMIRTERLRALGGFADGLEVSGWEDYDLWCRVADRGWRGQLVPQILGRYRVSPERIRRLSDVPPVTALLDRAPQILAGVLKPRGA